MNIVVCGKVIPASSVTIEIDPSTKRMVRKGVPHELDPAAASAVEEGLRLTEKHGGAVTLVTMGISDATIGIRSALAMGAANAVHILDGAVAGSDTLWNGENIGRRHQKTAVRSRDLRHGEQRQLFRHCAGPDRPLPRGSRRHVRQGGRRRRQQAYRQATKRERL